MDTETWIGEIDRGDIWPVSNTKQVCFTISLVLNDSDTTTRPKHFNKLMNK